MISFLDVSYVYNPKSPLETEALKGINLEIREGSFTAIVGRTGCGKSTLIQHINALLIPSDGEVKIDEFINCKDKKKRNKKLMDLRKKAGIVFQFPEYQLFEDTVEKDVAFGPKNFGLNEKEALEEAHKALSLVGMDESFYARSPLELSGGEKRRVAIAGILAIHPKYLIIDEPTAGLDPLRARHSMDLFEKIHQDGTTVIMVTHDMNAVLDYATEVVVIDSGHIEKSCTPKELFGEDIDKYSLETPLVYSLFREMKEKGYEVEEGVNSIADLAKSIAKRKRK